MWQNNFFNKAIKNGAVRQVLHVRLLLKILFLFAKECLSCFLHLLWENRAFDLSPPTRSVSCSSSSFAPGGETHLLPFSFYCSSPCYLWPSSGPLPFWCPGQSNAWILLVVVHAKECALTRNGWQGK